MRDIYKCDKLDLIKNLSREHGITAYEIGENTEVSNVTVHNILTGKSNNPRTRTLNIILQYIESKIVGKSVPGHKNYDENFEKENTVNEPEGYQQLQKSMRRLESLISGGHSLISEGIAEILLDTDEIIDTQSKQADLLNRLATIIENRRAKRSETKS